MRGFPRQSFAEWKPLIVLICVFLILMLAFYFGGDAMLKELRGWLSGGTIT